MQTNTNPRTDSNLHTLEPRFERVRIQCADSVGPCRRKVDPETITLSTPFVYLLSLSPSLHPLSLLTASNSLPLSPTDGSAAVPGGPGSPLQVEVSDVNKDYVFLRWQPPSADGATAVQGYYIERYGNQVPPLKYCAVQWVSEACSM